MTTHPRIEQINQNREAAGRIITEFSRDADNIRSDRSLSAEGKRDALAKRFATDKAAISGLLESEKQIVAEWKSELERSIFGWQPTDNLAEIQVRRESNEKADALADPRDAVAMYEAARVRSDAHLEAAVVSRALSAGWHAVTNDYLARNPERAAEVSDLRGIEAHFLSIEAGLNQAMCYSLSKPNELAHVDMSAYEASAQPSRYAAGPASVQQAEPRPIGYGDNGRPIYGDGLDPWRGADGYIYAFGQRTDRRF